MLSALVCNICNINWILEPFFKKKRVKQKPDGGQQHKKERKNKSEEKGEINKQLNDWK